MPTVFVHAGWRCASTYVWSRLRVLANTTSFYEPFGEHLAYVSAKRIARDTAQGWNSRHPALEQPYRAEYRALLRPPLRGVPGYRESFALKRYFPCQGVHREMAYLERLIAYARRCDTAPVLGFSRSLARAPALKAGLGGYHLVLRRAAARQWLSCRSFRAAGVPSYFELCHALILAQAPADSPAGRFATELGLPALKPWIRSVTGGVRALHAALGAWSDERSYQAFIAVYLLSHGAAAPAADLVLDVDRFGDSPAYRERISTQLRQDTRLAVDFGDFQAPSPQTGEVRVDFAAIEADTRRRLIACGAPSGALEFIQ